jgi:hypothetical protein
MEHITETITLDPAYADGDEGAYSFCSCGWTGLLWPTTQAAIEDRRDHEALHTPSDVKHA